MITPDTFNNLDDFITIVNQMKLNKLTIAAFKVDKDDLDEQNEFLWTWRYRPNIPPGDAR